MAKYEFWVKYVVEKVVEKVGNGQSMTILGKHYVTKLSYAGGIDFALYLHFLFKSAVSAAFAAHSISAVFIA